MWRPTFKYQTASSHLKYSKIRLKWPFSEDKIYRYFKWNPFFVHDKFFEQNERHRCCWQMGACERNERFFIPSRDSRHLRFSGGTILIKMMSMLLTNLTSSIVNYNQNAFKLTYQAIQGKYSEVFASRTP